MTWSAIYRIANGELVSIGTVVADPLPDGLAAKDVGAEMPVGDWNPATLAFEMPAVVTVLSPQDFMGLFSFDEEKAIRTRAQTDMTMTTFLARVQRARSVTLSHPDTINGVNYCMAVGCISAARATEILGG